MDDLERRLRGLADQSPAPPTPVEELDRRVRRRRTVHRVRMATAMAAAVALVSAAVVFAWPDSDKPSTHVFIAPPAPTTTTTALPLLPRAGLAYDDGNGVVITDQGGKELVRLAGYSLDSLVDRPGPLTLEGPDGYVTLDAGRLRPVGGVPLAGGAEFRIQPARVVRPGHPDWDLSLANVFVSHRRDLVTGQVNGSSEALDLKTGTRRTLPAACSAADHFGDILLLVCDAPDTDTVELLDPAGHRTVLNRHTEAGFWRAAYMNDVATPGTSVLLQHSGECEVPTAYHLTQGRLRPIAVGSDGPVESTILGWYGDFVAFVQLREGACGAGYDKPGVYALGPHDELSLVLQTTAPARFWTG